jgi:hypothetical protein
MIFWSNGKQMNTETMSEEEKVFLTLEVRADLQAVHDMIDEFIEVSNDGLRQFALKHFGRDGDLKLYTDRDHVADRLEWKLTDLKSSDRYKALEVLGRTPVMS